MSLPKILLTNFHQHRGGGHTTFIKTLVTSRLQEQFEFAVTAPEGSYLGALMRREGIKFYPCEFEFKILRPFKSLHSILRFREICECFKPNIVHVNGAADMSTALFAYLGREKSFKLVRTQHAIRAIPNHSYHRWLYNQIDRYLYTSRQSRDLSIGFKDAWRPKEPIVIENGVDLEVFTPRPKDQELLSRLSIQENEMIIGSCAGLGSYKRVDLMIRAIHRLKGKYSFKVILLGSEKDWPKVEKLIKQLNIGHIIQYVGFEEDVRPYCSLFDIGFVLSDRNETLSYAAREMMAMGIPLISSDFSGLPDNVDHELNGWIVPAGQLEPLVSRLEACLTMDRFILERYRLAAREKAVRCFNIHGQIKVYKALYGKLITQSHKA